MDKKATDFPMGVVITLVLIGVALVLYLPIHEVIASYIVSGGDSGACTLSLMNGQNKARCPIRDVKIYPDKVEISSSGKKPEPMKLAAKDSTTRAKEAVTKLLQQCLAMGGGTSSKAFSRENYADTERVCLQCYSLSFIDTPQIDNLLPYLTSVKDSNGKLYIETLTRDDAHKSAYLEYGLRFASANLAPSSSEKPFEQNRQYTIFFIGNKKGKIPTTWDSTSDLVQLNLLKAFLQINDAYFAYIAESSKLGTVCQRLVN